MQYYTRFQAFENAMALAQLGGGNNGGARGVQESRMQNLREQQRRNQQVYLKTLVLEITFYREAFEGNEPKVKLIK